MQRFVKKLYERFELKVNFVNQLFTTVSFIYKNCHYVLNHYWLRRQHIMQNSVLIMIKGLQKYLEIFYPICYTRGKTKGKYNGSLIRFAANIVS